MRFCSIKIACRQCGKETYQIPAVLKAGYGKFCSKRCHDKSMVLSDQDRFDRHISKPNENGCILWIGAKDKGGYGIFCSPGHGSKQRKSHRIAWELKHGPIPNGLHVLHHCDNPPCVNIDHLFLGTNDDNIADMVSKKRHRHGESHTMCKMTETQVLEIRKRFTNGETRKQIAIDFPHVTAGNIWCIIKHISWKHVKP